MTAQDQYRQMLKDCITPALRERGWRGGSGRYYLHGATGHVGSLVLSGNHRRSTADVRTFDLHVGVVSRYLQEFKEGTGQASTTRPTTALQHDWFEEVASFTIAAEDDPLEVGGFVRTIIETQSDPKSHCQSGRWWAARRRRQLSGRRRHGRIPHPHGDRPGESRHGSQPNRLI